MGGRFKATEEITVPQCICHVGYYPGECAYVIFNTVDEFFAEKEPVDNLEEGHSDMVG